MLEDVAARLAAIQARADAATPGPWTYAPGRDPHSADPYAREGDLYGPSYVPIPDSGAFEPADMEFVAHAREDIPYLLALVAEQQAEIMMLRRQVWREDTDSSALTFPQQETRDG
jgi:hypothetical protein